MPRAGKPVFLGPRYKYGLPNIRPPLLGYQRFLFLRDGVWHGEMGRSGVLGLCRDPNVPSRPPEMQENQGKEARGDLWTTFGRGCLRISLIQMSLCFLWRFSLSLLPRIEASSPLPFLIPRKLCSFGLRPWWCFLKSWLGWPPCTASKSSGDLKFL